MTDQQLLTHAKTLCTPKQLEALELKARGYGKKRSSRILGISEQAVASRLAGARRRLDHLEAA